MCCEVWSVLGLKFGICVWLGGMQRWPEEKNIGRFNVLPRIAPSTQAYTTHDDCDRRWSHGDLGRRHRLLSLVYEIPKWTGGWEVGVGLEKKNGGDRKVR